MKLVYLGNAGRSYDLATVIAALERGDWGELGPVELHLAGSARDTGSGIVNHGYLGAAELQALLSECDLGIIPMRDDSWVGLPNKLADYAVARLKVVSSLGGECAELIERHRIGTHYRAGDAADFVRAVRAAAELPSAEADFDSLLGALDAAVIYPAYVRRIEALVRG